MRKTGKMTLVAAMAVIVAVQGCVEQLVTGPVVERVLTVNPDTLRLQEGETGRFGARCETYTDGIQTGKALLNGHELTWIVSDDDIATAENGKITAGKPGKTVIRAEYKGEMEEVVVVVTEKPEKLEKGEDEPKQPEDEEKDDQQEQEKEPAVLRMRLHAAQDTLAMPKEKIMFPVEVEINEADKVMFEEYRQEAEYFINAGAQIDSETGKGNMWFTMPSEGNAKVMFVFSNGETRDTVTVKAERYTFTSGSEEIGEIDDMGSEAGLGFETTLSSDMLDVTVSEEWVSVKSIDTEKGVMTIGIDRNTGLDPRTAVITLKERTGVLGEYTWTVSQRWGRGERRDGYVWFECNAFKKAMLAGYDSDCDGEISYAEAAEIEHLDMSSKGITSFEGIQHMTGLRSLDISDNPLPYDSVVDLSGDHMLLIDIRAEGLKDKKYPYDTPTVDVSGCPVLVQFTDKSAVNYIQRGVQCVMGKSLKRSGWKENKTDYRSQDYSRDSEVVQIQQHTKGDGIALWIIGKGLTDKDLESGAYERLVDMTYERLFVIEPFKSYQHFFDIYWIVDIDAERGELDDNKIDMIEWNRIAKNHMNDPQLGNQKFISIMAISNTKDYVDGFGHTRYNLPCTTLVEEECAYTIAHELGHLIGNLQDEYLNDYKGLAYEQYYDRQYELINISFTSDPEKVPWSRFLKDDTYKHYVGIFEGEEISTPTEDSIMRGHDYPVFNAPSRYAIHKEILGISRYMFNKYGSGFTEDDYWKEFVEYDVINLRDEDRITPVLK